MDRLIAELLTHPNLEDAAAAAGVSRTSAWRWLKSADFIARLRTARRDAMQRAMARLQEVATQSVDTLNAIQTSGESESARVSAARTILELALRSVELQDVEERIGKLEEALKSRNWRGAGNDTEPNQAAPGGARTINGRA